MLKHLLSVQEQRTRAWRRSWAPVLRHHTRTGVAAASKAEHRLLQPEFLEQLGQVLGLLHGIANVCGRRQRRQLCACLLRQVCQPRHKFLRCTALPSSSRAGTLHNLLARRFSQILAVVTQCSETFSQAHLLIPSLAREQLNCCMYAGCCVPSGSGQGMHMNHASRDRGRVVHTLQGTGLDRGMGMQASRLHRCLCYALAAGEGLQLLVWLRYPMPPHHCLDGLRQHLHPVSSHVTPAAPLAGVHPRTLRF